MFRKWIKAAYLVRFILCSTVPHHRINLFYMGLLHGLEPRGLGLFGRLVQWRERRPASARRTIFYKQIFQKIIILYSSKIYSVKEIMCIWYKSYIWTADKVKVIFAVVKQLEQLQRKPRKKFWGFNATRFEPMTSAIPVRCSTKWAIKPRWKQVKSEFDSVIPVVCREWDDVHSINHMYELRIKNHRSDSDLRGFEAI